MVGEAVYNPSNVAGPSLAVGAKCVIPARYESTRLPGKPLIDFGGKPMIVRTYERACRQFAPRDIIIATDDWRIVAACRKHGIDQVEITSRACRTGTDRVAEVARRYPGVNVWVNIQGDEPLLPDGIVTPLLNGLSSAVVATNGMALITDLQDVVSDTIPKVVVNNSGHAMYLSRRAIPWQPDRVDTHCYYRQVCVYAFWKQTLARFAELETGPCERAERIEILRLVEHGYKVGMVKVPGEGISVDVPADVERVKQQGEWA